MTICPKCNSTTGDDWKQCGFGPCPMREREPGEFAAFQARITASERVIAERDIYERADRWAAQGVQLRGPEPAHPTPTQMDDAARHFVGSWHKN